MTSSALCVSTTYEGWKSACISKPSPPFQYTAGQYILYNTPHLIPHTNTIADNCQTLDGQCFYLHCSNGIGRSGIFITLPIVLERMVAEGLVNMLQTIKNLRIWRPAMVQTLVRLYIVAIRIETAVDIGADWIINQYNRISAVHIIGLCNVLLLTLGAHAQRGLRYLVCLSVCV